MATPSVERGDTIVWDVNGERQAIIEVDAKSRVKLGKVFCPASALIGCPYGAMFTLGADGKTLERTAYVPSADWDLPDAPDFNTRTNAGLVDGGLGHQALQHADIEAMKAEGRAGAEIVAALAANSATFATKTEFSQEKYKKKKAKKYVQVATVRCPTAATVCEAYFASSPAKTSYLRVDTLALLLSMANVGAHAKVLVVESCGGLISAAALERLGPASAGCVVSAWAGGPGARQPGLGLWRHFNFPPAQRAALRFAPLHELLAERRQQAEQQEGAAAGQEDGQAMQVDAQQAVGEGQQQQPAAAEQQQQADEQPGAGQQAAAAATGAQAQQQGAQQQAQLQQAPFNCCILAAHSYSPLALVKHVLPLLAPSASLAVYSPWSQPLAEAMDALRSQGLAAGLSLQETWWREMQVLPLRTHPTMNMNHGGGFIMSGTVLAAAGEQGRQ